MSLNGVSGVPATLLRPQEGVRPRIDQDRPAPATQTPPPAVDTTTRTGLLAPRQETLPVEAPEGTDPELWEVLSAEERAYFAKMTAMGPLTYGAPSRPATSAETPMGRGGRIDVRA
ncbi:MAG: hypothetical protein WD031_04170 [Gemmatimonadota bacterium]